MSSRPADERSKVGREATREALIDATAQIMVDEGYAAATSRRVAASLAVWSPPRERDLKGAFQRRGFP